MGINFVQLLENNAVLLVAIIVFLIVFRKKNVKNIKVGPGGFEVEHQTDADRIKVIDPNAIINPNDNCPYDKAYTSTRNAIREVDDKVITLEERIEQDFQALTGKHEQSSANEKKIQISLLKIILNMPTAPPEERVKAGLECIFLGENSITKKDTVGISKKYPSIYKAICVAKPEYRIPEVDEMLASGA